MFRATILVVVDDATTCRQLRHLFAAAGWKYRATRYASDAIRLLDDMPDSVILNVGLASADILLGTLDASERTTFVVALIGDRDARHRDGLGDCFRADAVCIKPVDVQAVFKICEAERRKSAGAIRLFRPMLGLLARDRGICGRLGKKHAGSTPQVGPTARRTETDRRGVLTAGPKMAVADADSAAFPREPAQFPWLTSRGAAEMCGVPLSMIGLWVSSGAWPLPQGAFATARCFRLSDVQTWLDNGTWPASAHFQHPRMSRTRPCGLTRDSPTGADATPTRHHRPRRAALPRLLPEA